MGVTDGDGRGGIFKEDGSADGDHGISHFCRERSAGLGSDWKPCDDHIRLPISRPQSQRLGRCGSDGEEGLENGETAAPRQRPPHRHASSCCHSRPVTPPPRKRSSSRFASDLCDCVNEVRSSGVQAGTTAAMYGAPVARCPLSSTRSHGKRPRQVCRRPVCARVPRQSVSLDCIAADCTSFGLFDFDNSDATPTQPRRHCNGVCSLCTRCRSSRRELL
jgi:hypothetical protein